MPARPHSTSPTDTALAAVVLAEAQRATQVCYGATLHGLADSLAGRITRAELRRALDALTTAGRVQLIPEAGRVTVEVVAMTGGAA